MFSREEWLKQAGQALRSRTLPDGNPPASVSGQGELQVSETTRHPPPGAAHPCAPSQSLRRVRRLRGGAGAGLGLGLGIMQLNWNFSLGNGGAGDAPPQLLLWKLVLPSVCAADASAVVRARAHPLQPPAAVPLPSTKRFPSQTEFAGFGAPRLCKAGAHQPTADQRCSPFD